jgi:acetyl esterase
MKTICAFLICFIFSIFGIDKEDYTVRGERDITIRIYSPQARNGDDIILFAHGGGWTIGNIKTYDNFCTNFSNFLKLRLISIDYSLAPRYKFPAAINDFAMVCKWCYSKEGYKTLGKNHRIILCGDSAGGNLCLATCIKLRNWKLAKKNIYAQILFYPFIENDFASESFVKFNKESSLTQEQMMRYIQYYTGFKHNDEKIINNALIYPALYKDTKIFPPTLVISAEYDILLSSQLRWEMKMFKDNRDITRVTIQKTKHGFITFAATSEKSIKQSLSIISFWLNRLYRRRK